MDNHNTYQLIKPIGKNHLKNVYLTSYSTSTLLVDIMHINCSFIKSWEQTIVFHVGVWNCPNALTRVSCRSFGNFWLERHSQKKLPLHPNRSLLTDARRTRPARQSHARGGAIAIGPLRMLALAQQHTDARAWVAIKVRATMPDTRLALH